MSKNDREFLSAELPYGKREYANGAKELFNRRYGTLLRKGPSPEGEMIKQAFYYSGSNPPWRDEKTRRLCETVLRTWTSRT